MHEFKNPFPADGFYVVIESFRAADLMFIAGEPVGVMWRGKCYVAKTGKEFGGFAEALERKHALKLRKLTTEEILKFTGGRPISKKVFGSLRSFAEACKLLDGWIEKPV